MNRKKRVLITGGSGRLGEFIINKLKDDYHISVMDIRKPEGLSVNFIKCDITDLEGLKKATENIDIIIHLAALMCERIIPTYPKGWDVNCTGTFNIFEAAVANNIEKVVYASSICATGIITWVSSKHSIEYFPVDEEHPCKPEDLYGTSKLVAEKLAWMYSKRSDTIFIGFRIATVWFKSDEGIAKTTEGMVNKYIKDPTAFLNLDPSPDEKRSIYKVKDPRAASKDLTWQYVDARDVAQAFKLSLEKSDIKCEVYNIGAGNTPTNWDSIKLAKYFYPGVPILDALSFLVDKKRPLWDITKAQKELGYRPEYSWEEYINGCNPKSK